MKFAVVKPKRGKPYWRRATGGAGGGLLVWLLGIGVVGGAGIVALRAARGDA